MKNKLLLIGLLNALLSTHFIVNSKEVDKVVYKSKIKNNNIESSQKLYNEARIIIVNSLPGEQIKAEKLLIESIRQNPKNVDSYIELAKLIQTQVALGNKYPQELQKSIILITQAYDLAPDRPRVCFARADLLYYTGQIKSAEELYLDTLARFPNHKDSLIEKARIFAERNPIEALRSIELALKKWCFYGRYLTFCYYCNFKTNKKWRNGKCA